jgi:nitrile hydratase
MSRINDVGGQTGFGPVDPRDGPVMALTRVLVAKGVFTIDEHRDAIERMPPGEYLAASYYERWLAGVETLLREKGVVDDVPAR